MKSASLFLLGSMALVLAICAGGASVHAQRNPTLSGSSLEPSSSLGGSCNPGSCNPGTVGIDCLSGEVCGSGDGTNDCSGKCVQSNSSNGNAATQGSPNGCIYPGCSTANDCAGHAGQLCIGAGANACSGTCTSVQGANPNPSTGSNSSQGTGFTALAPIPGLTSSNGIAVDSNVLAQFLNNLYKYLIGIAAILAIIEIIYGGLEISLQQSSIEKQLEARGRITQAIFGLVLVLSPVIVFGIINPSILNLSLNLPLLATKNGGSTSSGTGGTATQTQNGCSITGTYFQTITCDTTDAAAQFASSCQSSGGIGRITSDTTSSAKCTQTSITGGSNGGTNCSQQTTATHTVVGFCMRAPSGPYTFANVAKKLTVAGVPLPNGVILQPTNLSHTDVLNFQSQCKTDGGYTCVVNKSQLASCPDGTDVKASGPVVGGCYQGSLFCEQLGYSALPSNVSGPCVGQTFQ